MIHCFLSRFRASGAAVTLGLTLLAPTAWAQTVLDDFSTDQFGTNYVQKAVPGFNPGGWIVSGGQLQPNTSSNTSSVGGYAAFVWTTNSLQNVGDWFSIDLYVATTGSDHNAGLSLWQGSGTNFDRLLEPRVGFDQSNSNYSYVTSDQGGTVFSENVSSSFSALNLKLTVTDISAGNTTVDITLTGSGGLSISHSYEILGMTGPLFVGPSAWQADGSNIAFDNLTYYTVSGGGPAIPEPSTYAAIFGGSALAVAAWRRRRATRILNPISE